MTVHDIIHSVWRNHPRGATTMSKCECGRLHRRGSEPCLMCLRSLLCDKLGIPSKTISKFFKAVAAVRDLEVEITESVDHG